MEPGGQEAETPEDRTSVASDFSTTTGVDLEVRRLTPHILWAREFPCSRDVIDIDFSDIDFFLIYQATTDGDDSDDEERDEFEHNPDLFTYHNFRNSDIDAVGPNVDLVSLDLHQDKGSKGHRLIQGILESLAPPPGEPATSISVITDGGVRLPSL